MTRDIYMARNSVFIYWRSRIDGSFQFEEYELPKVEVQRRFLFWTWTSWVYQASAEKEILQAVEKAKNYVGNSDKQSISVMFDGHVFWQNNVWHSAASYVPTYIDC